MGFDWLFSFFLESDVTLQCAVLDLASYQKGEGWAVVLTSLALASWRWCYATKLKRFSGNKFLVIWSSFVRFCFSVCVRTVGNASHAATPCEFCSNCETIAESLVTYQQLGQTCFTCRAWQFESAKTRRSYGKKQVAVCKSPYNCEFRNFVSSKNINNLARLESTIYVALPLRKMCDIFVSMELRIKASNMAAHFLIGINNIRCHESVKNHMSYHTPIWEADLV